MPLKADALSGAALLAHGLPRALQLLRHLLIGDHNLIKGVGNLARHPAPRNRQAHAEVAVLHRLQALKNGRKVLGFGQSVAIGLFKGRVIRIVLAEARLLN